MVFDRVEVNAHPLRTPIPVREGPEAPEPFDELGSAIGARIFQVVDAKQGVVTQARAPKVTPKRTFVGGLGGSHDKEPVSLESLALGLLFGGDLCGFKAELA